MRPLVSILITTFNSERYIEEALRSALAQTYPNFEVVIVDGGSKDKTKEIIESHRDARIRAIFPGVRLGIKEGRNRLFKEAKGEYWTFLDSDDVYLSEKVAEEAAFLDQNPEYAAVYCDLRYFFDGRPEKLYRHKYTFYSGDIFEELLKRMFITNTTLMFRKSVFSELGGYDESLGMVEDWDYFLRMAHAGHKIGFLPKDLVRYRLRWDNNTNFKNQVPIQESAVKIFENLHAHMSAEEKQKYRMERILAKRRLRLAIAYLAMGRKTEGCAMLRKALPGSRGSFWCGIGSLIPSKLARFVVEKAWNLKKKNLFIPVDSRG
ncbi:MAG: glycosyltransferase [Candidatus Liptonbacteria bacterium]|nr:glycosyltransferase [Candidatus Liptonbacteria bacterium]